MQERVCMHCTWIVCVREFVCDVFKGTCADAFSP